MMRTIGVCVFFAAAITLSAQRSSASAAGNVTKGCVERFDAATDYFPEKAAIEDAAKFSIEYRRSYKVVTVKEGYPGGPAERYVLVQCGTPAPGLTGDLAAAHIVTVPITSLFVLVADTSLISRGSQPVRRAHRRGAERRGGGPAGRSADQGRQGRRVREGRPGHRRRTGRHGQAVDGDGGRDVDGRARRDPERGGAGGGQHRMARADGARRARSG